MLYCTGSAFLTQRLSYAASHRPSLKHSPSTALLLSLILIKMSQCLAFITPSPIHSIYLPSIHNQSLIPSLSLLPLYTLPSSLPSSLPQTSSSLPSLSDSSLSFPIPLLLSALPCPSPTLLRTASQLNPLLYSTSGGYYTSSTKRRRSYSLNSSPEGAFVVSYPALYCTVLLF